MNRKFVCRTSPNKFCFVCGSFLYGNSGLNITPAVCEWYFNCYGFPLPDQDKEFAPHVICKCCYYSLRRNNSPYAVPMVWYQQTCHPDNCYFCKFELVAGSKKNVAKKQGYPDVPSAVKPVLRVEDCQPSTSTAGQQSTSTAIPEEDSDSDFEMDLDREKGQITKHELDNLIADLSLNKRKSELLASRLREFRCLSTDVRISQYRIRNNELAVFFCEVQDITFCRDIPGLFAAMDLQFDASEWRLFIDSSVESLKAVLVHIGNVKFSVPIAYSRATKEEYFRIKEILELTNYPDFEFFLCCDLKMVAILMGLQSGNTKYSCFLCHFDSRDRANHWNNHRWPPRTSFIVGSHNVRYERLVQQEKIIIPPLHVKLGLMYTFMVNLVEDGPAIKYLVHCFGKSKSLAKIKGGVFSGPEIKKLFKDNNFQEVLSEDELNAWLSFKDVAENFLGKHRAPDYKEKVSSMLTHYQRLGANLSLKLHFMKDHLDDFPANLVDYSDEHGERFHQTIKCIEKDYKGKSDISMLADYCWIQKNKSEKGEYKRTN